MRTNYFLDHQRQEWLCPPCCLSWRSQVSWEDQICEECHHGGGARSPFTNQGSRAKSSHCSLDGSPFLPRSPSQACAGPLPSFPPQRTALGSCVCEHWPGQYLAYTSDILIYYYSIIIALVIIIILSCLLATPEDTVGTKVGLERP